MFGAPDLSEPETFETWGAYDNLYAFPAFRTDYGFVASPVPSGAWRSVFYPPSVFARESFVDELAAAAHRDPLELRRALLSEPRTLVLHERPYDRHRLRRVLEIAAQQAGWGTPLAKGRGRGIAANMYHGRTCVAQVAEVTMAGGQLRVDRIVCVVDCGTVVNPLGAEGQVESAIAWGLSAALKTEVRFRDGRPQLAGYRDFPVLRLSEMPRVEVRFAPTPGEIPSGLGEQPVPTVAPAVTNAIFAATGKRVRRLPLNPKDLA
jgi:CO/xanthine dehydrogenase Mo-binding subunit